jgi:hypothetical protein
MTNETVAPKQLDFTVQNEGTIFLLQPLTVAAREWINDNLPEQRLVYGTAVVVEHRYIQDIVQGIINDGLVVA